MKTKIKILLASVIILVMVAGAILLVLANTSTSYFIEINRPDRMVVYINSSVNNIVYEKDSEEYNEIYNSIKKCYTQNKLTSLRGGKLFEKTKVLEANNQKIDFKTLTISFDYYTPQAVKVNGKTYDNNGEAYWYKSLIFTIPNNDWQYNTIAIIEPNADYPFNYNLYYNVYSNYSLEYENLYKFKR